MESADYNRPIFDIDEDEEEEVAMVDTEEEEEENASAVMSERSKSEGEKEDGDDKNMALTTRMSQTVANVSRKVFSYFQKGRSVVFRWFWVGGIVFWVVGLPLIRTREKQVRVDEFLAMAAHGVEGLSRSKGPTLRPT